MVFEIILNRNTFTRVQETMFKIIQFAWNIQEPKLLIGIMMVTGWTTEES
jgi:hypothetical protein